MATNLACDPFMTVEEFEALDSCADCLVGVTDEQLAAWIDEASDLIAILSGMRVYGRCSLVARPCRKGLRCGCDCCHLDAIPLGDMKPTIDEVLIDGVTISPEEYDLHWGLNGWSLVLLGDGTTHPGYWPSYQKRYLADTEDDTFAVYLTVGVHVDRAIVQAAVVDIVCDIAAEVAGGYRNVNELEDSVIQAQVGNATVVVDRERLARLQHGEISANMNRLLGVLAPQGRAVSAVYAPELAEGWDLNLRQIPVVGS